MAAALSGSLATTSTNSSHTITGLKRWSCQNKELPPVPLVKVLHVYDFDNTLFKSPLPNPKLWNPYTVSRLQNQDVFANGGWWHDNRMLEATGQGIDFEESRAWSGWWNEQIAELVRLSAEQTDVLSVLLTGRAERNFSELIKRMVASKNLRFDLVCLKPEAGPKNQRFTSTMQYKQAFLQDLVFTYHDAEEIKIYEDRPKQTKAFRDFFQNLNQITFPDTARRSLQTKVVQVADQATFLDPIVETAEVQRMINRHNAQLPPMARPLEIKRTLFSTGYLISPSDTAKLLDLVKIPPNLAEAEIRYFANSILIVPRLADQGILTKVGGMGRKQTWQVTGFAFYQSNLWAVRVAAVPPMSPVYTAHSTPLIVLATYKNTKPELANNIRTWQPVPTDKQYILQTEVGEKVQLRIEASDEIERGDYLDHRGIKRRYSPSHGAARLGPNGEENRRPFHPSTNGKTANNLKAKGTNSGILGARAGVNQGRGIRARQKGPKGGYRSLDEMPSNNAKYGGTHYGDSSYENYNTGNGMDRPIKDTNGGLPYGQ